MSLVDCGNNLHLNWSAICAISVAPKEVLVIATPDKVKLLQYLKSGFKQTVKWNNCQSKEYNLNSVFKLSDWCPSFQRVNTHILYYS